MAVAIRTITRLQDADDLGSTPGAGNDGYNLTWDNASGTWLLVAAGAGGVALTDYNNVVIVDAAGNGDYDSLYDACVYVTSQTPSATNRWLIWVAPGVYTETDDIAAFQGIAPPSYTSIIGQGPTSTVIQNTNATNDGNILKVPAGCTQATVRGIRFQELSNYVYGTIAAGAEIRFFDCDIFSTGLPGGITVSSATAYFYQCTFVAPMRPSAGVYIDCNFSGLITNGGATSQYYNCIISAELGGAILGYYYSCKINYIDNYSAGASAEFYNCHFYGGVSSRVITMRSSATGTFLLVNCVCTLAGMAVANVASSTGTITMVNCRIVNLDAAAGTVVISNTSITGTITSATSLSTAAVTSEIAIKGIAVGRVIATIQALASQTADLLNIQDSSANLLLQVAAAGSTTIKPRTALTSTVNNALTLGHNSSGTPAAGFGNGLQFNLKSSTTESQAAALIVASWIVATHATRTARLTLSATDYNGTREGVRVDSDGTNPLLGFYGTAATTQQVLATGAGATVDNVITALQNLGLVKQS